MTRVTVLLILLVAALSAAPPRASSPDADFLVRAWQSEDGLPGNVVRSLGQDNDGFLWVVTAEGIARFDGLEFEKVRAADGGRNRRLALFRIFTTPRGVWVSTFQGGLLRVRNMSLVRILDDEERPMPPLVRQVIRHHGSIHFKRGPDIWRIDRGEARPVREPDESLVEAFQLDLQQQQRGGRSTGPARQPTLTDRDGGTWSIGPDQQLHHVRPGAEPRVLHFSESDPGIRVQELLEDREGNVWIATPSQGLIRFRPSRVEQFQTPDGPRERAVQTAVQTRDGAWWIALRSGGVDRLQDGVLSHFELVPTGYPRPVTCIFEDSTGRLWFASQDGTVFEWNGGGFTPRFPRTQTPSKVKAIAEDHSGSLWFGGSQGLCRLDGGDVEPFEDEVLLQDTDVTALAPLADGGILAGTIDGRVLRRTGTGFQLLPPAPDMQGYWITSLLPLADDEVWVATLGAGLFLWKNGRWTQFDRQDGLPDQRLTALILHDEDQLWCGSLGGILRVSRSELIRRTTNRDLVPSWLRLDRSDGLLTRECVGGPQPSVWRARDGTLWFPTGRGLAGVRPDRIQSLRTPPPTHIRSVTINGQPQPVTADPLITGPGRVRAAFSYTGLSLGAPEKVTYRIRLAGLDDQLQFIGSQRSVNYEAIPPGRYRFEVYAISGDGVPTKQPAVVDLVVRPHLWQTGWFLVIAPLSALLLALAIGWLVARSRMKGRIQTLKAHGMVEAERSRISRDLHDDLGASLTELSLLSALGAEKPDEKELRPVLENLSRKAKVVVTTLDEIVWAANPSEDSLRSLVEYLCAFAREFLDNVGLPLRTEVPRSLPTRTIGPRRRHNVFLATREALNNAVKYASAPEVRLLISIEDGQLAIRIRDDGRGFDPETVISGNGLDNLRRRMEDCGGTCRIESEPGSGTTVTLLLPLPPPQR